MNTTAERCEAPEGSLQASLEALVVAHYSKESGTAPTAEERLAGA